MGSDKNNCEAARGINSPKTQTRWHPSTKHVLVLTSRGLLLITSLEPGLTYNRSNPKYKVNCRT